MSGKVHSGHRKRLRDRAEKYGFDSLEDHEFLELLLFYAIPRVNTNPIAHELINRFGSLGDVLDASVEELREAGLSERAAHWVHFLPDFSGMYKEHYARETSEKIDDDKLCEYIKEKCRDVKVGNFLEIVMNVSGQIIFTEELTTYPENIRKEVMTACGWAARNNAYYIVLAHKYDETQTEPSEYDCCMTEEYCRGFDVIGITLKDRYHVTNSSCVSYKKLGAFFENADSLYTSPYYKLILSNDPFEME